MEDVIAALGPVYLGSRLRRLAERMQAGAAQVLADAGLAVQPTHMPVLTALDRLGPLSVGALADALGSSQPGVTRSVRQLAALGLVETMRGESDRRQTAVSLTPDGKAAMTRAKRLVWPRVDVAVRDMCAALSGPLLDQIEGLEQALAARPLDARVRDASADPLVIVDYDDGLAADFRAINEEWIEAMFRMEQADREVLDDPHGRIIAPGGAILFVSAPGLGIVGTGALRRTGDNAYELTKMGVRANARGLKAGEFLLRALIARAREMGAARLYLLTNRKCEAAIHLYEKAGFVHDAEIMADYGARYDRCDVAMRYQG